MTGNIWIFWRHKHNAVSGYQRKGAKPAKIIEAAVCLFKFTTWVLLICQIHFFILSFVVYWIYLLIKSIFVQFQEVNRRSKQNISSKDLILIKPSLVDINRQFSSISIEITFSVGFFSAFRDGFTWGSVVFPCGLHGVCGLVRSVLDVRCCLSVRKNTRSLA